MSRSLIAQLVGGAIVLILLLYMFVDGTLSPLLTAIHDRDWGSVAFLALRDGLIYGHLGLFMAGVLWLPAWLWGRHSKEGWPLWALLWISGGLIFCAHLAFHEFTRQTGIDEVGFEVYKNVEGAIGFVGIVTWLILATLRLGKWRRGFSEEFGAIAIFGLFAVAWLGLYLFGMAYLRLVDL